MDIFGGRRKTAMGITADLRCAAAKLVELGKSAVDSAVYDSLSGGMQVYTTAKSNMDALPAHRYDDKKTRFDVVEQTKEKQEKMQKEMNSLKQQEKVSVHRSTEQDIPEQFSDEPLKCSTPETPCRKMIFIRSRL